MHTIWVRVVDSEYRPVKGARVTALDSHGNVALRAEADRWVAEGVAGGRLTLNVTADKYEPEAHTVAVRDDVTQVVIGLRRPGQLSYGYGNDRLAFTPKKRSFILHVRGKGAKKALAAAARSRKIAWKRASPSSSSGEDDVLAQCNGGAEAVRALVENLVNAKFNVRMARVIAHGDAPPIGLLGELVVRFKADVTRLEAERIAASVGWLIAREVRHAGNAYLLVREGDPSYEMLKSADALRASERVEYAEPNLLFAVELDAHIPNDPLWPQVPYLTLVNADDAWDRLDDVAVALRGGSPNIAIAIVDPEGVTPDHPDLTASLTDGTSKLLADIDFAASPIASQTVSALEGDHGTQCAGSATAAFNDSRGLPGVAPNCRLIGAHISKEALDEVLLADIYLWLAGFLNGNTTPGFPATPPAQTADVISMSWGPNKAPLSAAMRDCFDFLTTYGRSGKGCVLCFSIGNNGYVDFTDPVGAKFRAWPTYAKTIAVGASISVNPTSPVARSYFGDPNGNTINIPATVDTRALYSPYGAQALRKPDLVSPSSTAFLRNGQAATQLDPILAAVRVGSGAIDGCPGAAPCKDYSSTFGGTSHSTPTVAGAVALILSARPDLNWVQVRDILRHSCARIDAAQANAIGQWKDLDGDGVIDYSRWYGAGRLDVDEAVRLVLDPNLPLADVYVRENLADVGDVPSGGTWWESPDIWVRQDASEPIPAISWTTAPPHESARRGQDNAVFCRVRNRGQAPAAVVYVRAMIANWPGFEFQYPGDFQPSTRVGGPIPSLLAPGTYLIGEVAVTDLAPGADRVVKMIWPAALVPPATVSVMGTDVLWHPCLLLEASPHDGPAPVTGSAVPVQGDNNIAQRNITILDQNEVEGDAFVGVVVGTNHEAGVATLVLNTSRLGGAETLCLRASGDDLMTQLIAGVRRAVKARARSDAPPVENQGSELVVEKPTTLRVEQGGREMVVVAAPGSRIFSREARASSLTMAMVQHRGLEAIEIRGLQGQLEIPFALTPSQQALLLVAIPSSASGDLWISQRRGDGALSAGYGIRRNE
ncbi:MAG TPA: S8 family serine peptidase [Burkholderiales bacterium]|nr:S8 family serine peptidase [Burkholderiales bacterium]